MGVEAEAETLRGLIESIVTETHRGAVDKVEQVYDLLTSPAAAWLAGKTRPEAFAEHPYYVLFVHHAGQGDCYSNAMGSTNLTEIAARARLEISRGAQSAYVTQIIELLPESRS